MSAKIFRINYKSDFILTLNSDAGWMTPFCIKFWTGAPSQAYFVGWDGETYTHCAYDPTEPTKLLVQFDDHHLPIGDLKFQIAYHFTVADFPNDTEDEVINPASITTEIDGETYQVMLDFTGETAPEIAFSLPAYANEAQRIANEQHRIAAEEQRIANEEARISAETVRQQNEEQRIQQESMRVRVFAQLKQESEQATDAANAAATLANEKAQLAADKATLAQAAATLANQKAQLAADKAALAQSAAILANEKAQLAADKAALAQQKADYAKTQGDYAKDQGDYAKAQGDYAKDQGDYAKAKGDYAKDQGDYAKEQGDYAKDKGDICAADHQTAVADHQTATADHQTAAADHQTATADHTQAGNDHTRAESDHTRAESDHDAVELYVDSLGVFDLSKHNAVGGVLATYADLSAALTALNALESKYKYGGMSFKFVQSSDNKYVQYRYIGTATTGNPNPFLDEANWENMDMLLEEREEDGLDLALVDDNYRAIVKFSNGHIQTKNFNSEQAPSEATPSEGETDFAISDLNEKCIVIFENGHIRTKNFDSSKIVQTSILEGKYKFKKVSILGDSISTFGTPDSRNENGIYCYSYYPTETCRYSELGNVTEGSTTYQSIQFNVQDTWWMQVINRIGAILGINESWRGTRVSGTGESAFNNQTRINHLGVNGAPDLILVFGGANDAGGGVTIGTFNGGNYSDYDTAEKIASLPVTTFADAYKAMLIRLMYTYPLAEIVCILPTFTATYYTISAIDNYVEIIKEACDFFGIKWIDVRVSDINIFNKSTYLVDGIHPNAQGMTLLANKIYKHLIFD